MNITTSIIIGLAIASLVSVRYAWTTTTKLNSLEQSHAECTTHVGEAIDLIGDLNDVGVDEWLRDNDLYHSDTVQ